MRFIREILKTRVFYSVSRPQSPERWWIILVNSTFIFRSLYHRGQKGFSPNIQIPVQIPALLLLVKSVSSPGRGANEVLRCYFCLPICKKGYCPRYLLFPKDCSENQMRVWIWNLEPFEFWLQSLQSFLHYITFTLIFLCFIYVSSVFLTN